MRVPVSLLGVIAVTVACAASFAVARVGVQHTPEGPAPVQAPAWQPPVWLGSEARWLVEELTAAPMSVRGPSVRARSAVVADLDRGVILWARDPDTQRGVASLTKLVSTLTLAVEEGRPDLDRRHCVTPELWPPKPGAFSKFETGVCHTGWDFLGAALVHSDNRGAMALPWLASLPYEHFVAAMNSTTTELGLDATWVDPTGLGELNRASARDMLKVAVAVADHPWLTDFAAAPSWRIDREHGAQGLLTTNKLAEAFEPVAAKTGYTDDAGYCFASVLRTRSGRRLGVTVLGAPNSGARFDDVRRMVEWAETAFP